MKSNNVIEKVEKNIGLSWKQIAFRVLFGFIFASWVGFLPTYMVVHYMIDKHFFSYDIFTQGLFGINSFVFVSGVILLFLSFALFGFIPFMWASFYHNRIKKEVNGHRVAAWSFFVVAVFFHILLFVNTVKDIDTYFIFCCVGLTISILPCLFIGQPLKKRIFNWIPSFIFIFLTAILPLVSQDTNSRIVSLGLKTFRIGGMVEVSAKSKRSLEELVQGKLILQTPQNLYISDDKNLVVLPYSNDIFIEIKNK